MISCVGGGGRKPLHRSISSIVFSLAMSTKPIPESQSKEICDLMNSNHAASLYALALNDVLSRKGRKTKVSFVKMSGSVTLDSFTLSFVECQSGICAR